jgi:hypothetical protein
MQDEVYKTTCEANVMATRQAVTKEICQLVAPEIAVLAVYGLLAICALGVVSGRNVSVRVGALALSIA